jgi:iron complex outermembrane receptor protein
MNRERFRIALVLSALLPAGTALAEEAAGGAGKDDAAVAGKPEVVRVEESAPYIPGSNTLATRLPVPLLDTPTNVGTVNEPLIRDQYDLFLGQTLRNVSGVNPQTQTGIADYFLIRGFDSLSSGLVLTDGAAEPEVSFFQTYNVERVEVLKGPGGFLYGRTPLAGALAGVVNIVRRQPMPANFGRVGLSGGSFGTYQGTVDWNQADRDGDVGFRLNALYRESDFWRDDKGNRTWGVNPAVTFWLGPDSAVNVNVEYLDLDYQPDSGIPLVGGEVAGVDPETSYQSPFDFSDQEVARFQVDYQTKLSGSWDLRNKTYYRSLDWRSDGTLIFGVAPNPATSQEEVIRGLTLLDDRQEYLGNQLEGVFRKSAGGAEHSLLAGVELAAYRDDFTLDVGCDPTILGFTMQCLLPPVDLDDPVETATTFVTLPFDAGDSETLVGAPYAIYQVKPAAWFEALLGARYDVIDFQDDLTGESFDDSDVSPMLGLVFHPARRMSLYASASESFAPPSVRVDDPVAEEGRQYELGYKAEPLEGKVQTTLAVYQLDRSNIPIPDANGFTQQAGDQRSRGVELDVVAEPVRGLRAFLSYSYIDAEFTSFTQTAVVGFDPVTFQPIFGTVDRTGNRPAWVPEHLGNLWVTQRFRGGFGYGVGLRHVGEQFVAEDDAASIEAYNVGDAALFYSVGRWDFQVNFQNVTDEAYETRGFGSASVIPGAGRSLFGAVEVRF